MLKNWKHGKNISKSSLKTTGTVIDFENMQGDKRLKITREEVVCALKTLKNGKTPDQDELSVVGNSQANRRCFFLLKNHAQNLPDCENIEDLRTMIF